MFNISLKVTQLIIEKSAVPESEITNDARLLKTLALIR